MVCNKITILYKIWLLFWREQYGSVREDVNLNDTNSLNFSNKRSKIEIDNNTIALDDSEEVILKDKYIYSEDDLYLSENYDKYKFEVILSINDLIYFNLF